jgi:hypothetical protein
METSKIRPYFFCHPPGPPEATPYEHPLLAIAEGFRELGIDCQGNINYWQYSPTEEKYAIQKSLSDHLDHYHLVILSSTWHDMKTEHQLPADLFASKRKYKLVYIDASDGLHTPAFLPVVRRADLVLKCHFNKHYKYPTNFVPWQFGLTSRMLQYLKPIDFGLRKRHIVQNFRIGHPVRSRLETISQAYFYPLFPRAREIDSDHPDNLSEIDLLYWKNTGRRHNPSYYRRLSESLLMNAAGGGCDQMPRHLLPKEGTLMARAARAASRKLKFLPCSSVFQFDSWRFWESLVGGCCTIHVDLDKYGCTFPEQPVNGNHYIGVELERPEMVLQILESDKKLDAISSEGMNWARQNYSPNAVALRLLNHLGMSP